jgi:hypothetical protein
VGIATRLDEGQSHKRTAAKAQWAKSHASDAGEAMIVGGPGDRRTEWVAGDVLSVVCETEVVSLEVSEIVKEATC